MSTLGQVIDRTIRDYLTGPDQQPIRARLGASMTDSSTTISFGDTVAAPDELMAISPGVIVEVGLEQMLIASTANDAMTVIRGVNGTTAVPHSSGDLLTVAPTYARQTIFDAVCDEVNDLYPHVFRIVTEDVAIPSGQEFVEVDASYVNVRECYYVIGPSVQRVSGRVISGLGDTGKALVTTEGVFRPYNYEPGTAQPEQLGALRATFSASFPRPTAEADDLQAIGVQPEWERILTAGAAATIVAGHAELDQLDANFLSDATRMEAYPPGTAVQVSQRLYSLRNNLLDRAADRWIRSNRRNRDTWAPNNRHKL